MWFGRYPSEVKLGPAFFIPNGALGTLGAVTQFKSRLRHRSQLFDVAAAGPIAGGLVGAYLFVNGLAMSVGGDPSDLLPVPAGLLQVRRGCGNDEKDGLRNCGGMDENGRRTS